MLSHNFFSYSGKLFFQILGEILYFPLWWYGPGLVRLLSRLGHFWLDQERLLGFSVWLRNIFVPMYGQRDIGGRLISFIMRLVQIILRGAVLIFWLVVTTVILVVWLLLPLALVLALNAQLISLGAIY